MEIPDRIIVLSGIFLLVYNPMFKERQYFIVFKTRWC